MVMRASYGSSRFETVIRDQFFVATPEGVGTGLDRLRSDLQFNEEVPSIIVAKNLTSATGTRRTVLNNITFNQIGVVADDNIRVDVFIDPTYRYTSGGVEITPRSNRPGWVNNVANNPLAEAEVYYGNPASYGGIAEILCSAANVNTRHVQPLVIQAADGGNFSIDFSGEVFIDLVGTVLIYIRVDEEATVNSDLTFALTFTEERLPRT